MKKDFTLVFMGLLTVVWGLLTVVLGHRQCSSLRPFTLFFLLRGEFGGDVLPSAVVEFGVHEVLHEGAGTVQQFVVVRDEVDESFEMIDLVFVRHSDIVFWVFRGKDRYFRRNHQICEGNYFSFC